MPPRLTVTRLEAFPGIGPYRWCLLKIMTAEGLVGWGETPLGTQPTEGQLRQVKGLLQEENILQVEKVWRLMGRGPAGLAQAVEMALWDLAGQALGAPVHQLLGGKLRDRVRLYADCHAGVDWTRDEFQARVTSVRAGGPTPEPYLPEAFGRRASEVKKQGFTALKFDLDVPVAGLRYDWDNRSLAKVEIEYMARICAAIRDGLGDTDFAVDCHARWNTSDAIRLAHALEPFDLWWLEDPVPPQNLDAMVKVTAAARQPICTGEALVGRHGFRELLVRQAADIIQPDIPRAGGLTEFKKIADLAELYYISVAPHHMTSPVATLAATHLCATVPNFLALEHHCLGIPFWNGVVRTPERVIERGFVAVPDVPGFGFEVDEDVVRAHMAGESIVV
ncbi:MAG: mandelate racemase/muconate lactonizing enzyme family protein [Chloroflexi bacterium]|nr:mandelate racemase/muconate lactonizing enzyme family protein [Chloroflexota bacterium]